MIVLGDADGGRRRPCPSTASRPVHRGVRAGRAERLGEVREAVALLLQLRAGSGRAPATVCERSPPESCIRTIAPLPGPWAWPGATIASTPGRCQSSLSVSMNDGDVAAAADVLGDRPGLVVQGVGEGGVRRPEERGADAGRARQRQLGLRQLPVDALLWTGRTRSGWLKVCSPTSWPSAHHPPHQVGVARGHGAGDEEDARARRASSSTSRTFGVQSGSGPSSKVSTSLRSGHVQAGGPASPRASMTGPPSRIFSGTCVGGGRRADAVVGEDLAVHIAAQHQHRHQRDQEERGQQIAKRQPALPAASGGGGHVPSAADSPMRPPSRPPSRPLVLRCRSGRGRGLGGCVGRPRSAAVRGRRGRVASAAARRRARRWYLRRR